MQASSSISEFEFSKHLVEKIKKMVSEREEMNEASLDAAEYNGDIKKYLENLPKDEVIKMLGKLIREEKEIQGKDISLQDAENQEDVKDRGRHYLKDVTATEDKKVQPATADAGSNNCPNDLGNHDVSVTGHRDAPNHVKEVAGVSFGYQDQPATDAGHHRSANDKDDTQDVSSIGQNKERISQSWEFPSQQSPPLTEQKVSDQQHAFQLGHSDENMAMPNPSHDSVSTNIENTDSRSDEDFSDSRSSSMGSTIGSTNYDNQPLGSTSPTQACADNYRDMSRQAIEHVLTLNSESDSRNSNSEHRNAPKRSSVQEPHRRSHVQGAQDDELSEHPNLQRHNLESCNLQLTETLLNYSRVAVQQANRETQDIQGASCYNCDALQEENYELAEKLSNLEEMLLQSQEQNTVFEQEISNQQRQQRQLQTQIASYEEIVRTQNEEKKDNKKIINFLTEINKKQKDEFDMANKRAYEFAEKNEKDSEDLHKTMKDITKAIEEVQRKFVAVKEENKILKKELQELDKGKWKEVEGKSGEERMHHYRGLRALQHSLGLRFSSDEIEENDLDSQHGQDDIDDVD